MGSNQKQVQIEQKQTFERKLKDRMDSLSAKGIDAGNIDKDPHVKKLKANIRSMNIRLKATEANEKLIADRAAKKLEMAAAPKEPEEKKKKKVKEAAPAEGKEAKKKKA